MTLGLFTNAIVYDRKIINRCANCFSYFSKVLNMFLFSNTEVKIIYDVQTTFEIQIFIF